MKNKNRKRFHGSAYDEKPGQAPFTHGIYPEMYTDKLWTMRQYAGFSSAEDSNKRYQYLLSKGVTGLSIAFDLPTQTGYDSDHILSKGEVGKVGVPICTLDDVRILFDNIPLDEVSISMTINSTAPILLGFLIVLAKERGISPKSLRGTIQNDILKEYIARGTYIYPPYESMRLVTDVFEFCSKEMPSWNTISISGYHIREAGSSAAEELGFTFSNAIAYVEAAVKKGLKPDIFGKQLSFFFNGHNNFFEEIAKFRAARKIWATIMKNRFGVKEKKALMCRFHVQTAGSTLTAQQPDNNIVRTALQALAAIIGGAQSIHTNSKDEALSLPSKKSAELALRTQQIIAYESGVAENIDPISGSFFVEKLTRDLIKDTEAIISDIDEMGGAVEALREGYQEKKISKSAYDYQKLVESGKSVIVGINRFSNSEKEGIEPLKINEKAKDNQLKRLELFKKNREDTNLVESLELLRKNAKKEHKNLMPFIIQAIENKATLGEISDAMRDVFGIH